MYKQLSFWGTHPLPQSLLGCPRCSCLRSPWPSFSAQLCAAPLFCLTFILAAQFCIPRRFLVIFPTVGSSYLHPHLLFGHMTGCVSPTPLTPASPDPACSPWAPPSGRALVAWLGWGGVVLFCWLTVRVLGLACILEGGRPPPDHRPRMWKRSHAGRRSLRRSCWIGSW